MRDGTELQLGTSPLDTDHDDDGVSDLDDLAPTNALIAFTTATIPDGDLNADNQLDAGDGVVAARIVSDPSFGTPSAYHLAHGDVAPMGGAPNGIDVADELLILRGARGDDDVDGDGLASALELTHGASPFRADTDGDGLSDFDEVFPPPGTEPSEPGSRDSDEDGLTDEEETTAGQDGVTTNPGLPDTDGDHIPDGRDGTPLDAVVFYHGDHLGSTTVLTNHEGTELSRVLYRPFGEAFGGSPQRFGFTGQRFEAGLGIYGYGARFYDPGLGRFLSADSLVPQPFNPQSLNRYSYVSNDPLGRVDPTGTYDDWAFSTTTRGYAHSGQDMELTLSFGGYGPDFSDFNERVGLGEFNPLLRGPNPFIRDAGFFGFDLDRAFAAFRMPSQAGGYRSPEILRLLVPGQASWDAAINAYRQGSYGRGTAHAGAMLVEQVLYVATLGRSSTLPAFLQGSASGGTVAARGAAEATGQLHHAISRPIARALERHPTLAGKYAARDPRLTTRAADQAAHRGYQGWHRRLDREVVDWLDTNPRANPSQFESFLRGRYSQPDLLERFPGGLP